MNEPEKKQSELKIRKKLLKLNTELNKLNHDVLSLLTSKVYLLEQQNNKTIQRLDLIEDQLRWQ